MADDHTNERDIDGILASIDSMLREVHPQKTNKRKDAIQHAAAESQKKLKLTSTLPMITEDPKEQRSSIESDIASALIEDEKDVVTAKPRILLTESLLEPNSKEALPLWIETTESTEEDPTIPTKESTGAKGKADSPLLNITNNDEGHLTNKNIQPAVPLNTKISNGDTTFEDKESIEEINPAQHSNADSNAEQLNTIVESISHDVVKKLNQHLQDILPKLINEVIKDHLDKQ